MSAEPEFKPLQRDATYFDVHASSDAMADVLDISLESLRRAEQDGHLTKIGRGRFDFLGSIRKYIGHLREVAAGRGGGEEQAILATENAFLARAKRENMELRNAALRKDMLPAADVQRQWAEDLFRIRTHMLTTPSRIQAKLPHLTRAEVLEIDRIIRKALTEAATINDGPVAANPAGSAEKPAAPGTSAAVDVD